MQNKKHIKQKPRVFSVREVAGASVWCKRYGLGLSTGLDSRSTTHACGVLIFASTPYGRLRERFLPASNGTSISRLDF